MVLVHLLVSIVQRLIRFCLGLGLRSLLSSLLLLLERRDDSGHVQTIVDSQFPHGHSQRGLRLDWGVRIRVPCGCQVGSLCNLTCYGVRPSKSINKLVAHHRIQGLVDQSAVIRVVPLIGGLAQELNPTRNLGQRGDEAPGLLVWPVIPEAGASLYDVRNAQSLYSPTQMSLRRSLLLRVRLGVVRHLQHCSESIVGFRPLVRL